MAKCLKGSAAKAAASKCLILVVSQFGIPFRFCVFGVLVAICGFEEPSLASRQELRSPAWLVSREVRDHAWVKSSLDVQKIADNHTEKHSEEQNTERHREAQMNTERH